MADLIESESRKEQRRQKIRESELKDEILIMYVQAIQIRNMIANLINHENTIKDLSDYYPGWFAENKEKSEDPDGYEVEDGLTPEMREHKARMDDFVFRHNRAIEKRGESSGRSDTREVTGDNRSPDEGILSGASESSKSDETSN